MRIGKTPFKTRQPAEVPTFTESVKFAGVEDIEPALVYSTMIYGPLRKVVAELESRGMQHVTPLGGGELAGQAIGFVDGKRAWIAIRGSSTVDDWLLDALVVPIFRPMQHAGLGLAWRRLRPATVSFVRKVRSKSDELILTGHSLGGAVAKIAACELVTMHDVGRIVTFGAPRTFFLSSSDKVFGQAKANAGTVALSDRTISVVNGRDIVAKIPPLLFNDVGRPVYVDASKNVFYADDAVRAREALGMNDLSFFNWLIDPGLPGMFTPVPPAINGLTTTPSGAKRASIDHSSTNAKAKEFLKSMWQYLAFNRALLMISMPVVLYVLLILQIVCGGKSHLTSNYGVLAKGVVAPSPKWKPTISMRVHGIIIILFGLLLMCVALWVFWYLLNVTIFKALQQ